MGRSTLNPKGAAQKKDFQTLTGSVLSSIKLEVAGLITTPTPIAVVKNKPHFYAGGEKPTVEHMNKVKENIAGMKVMEQGTSFEDYQSQHKAGVKPTITPGNTKMQDYRAKGEAIINRAKQEGRMLSEIEQMKVKRMRHKYENEYKKVNK